MEIEDVQMQIQSYLCQLGVEEIEWRRSLKLWDAVMMTPRKRTERDL